MKVNAPCPACDNTPIDVLETLDGEIWICGACGHNEISAGVDVEAQLVLLDQTDKNASAEWRRLLGL